MLFNSWQFLIFFPVVLCTYFLFPHRLRWAFLLLASYFFYGCWKPEYLLLLWASTLIDYFVGIRIEEAGDKRGKFKWLLVCLFSNLGMLFYFKYYNFFNKLFIHSLAVKMGWDTKELDVILPVGLSFYTFQSIAYVVDVYREKVKAERHLGYYALYVVFWPQLVAGPIERAGHMLQQYRTEHAFVYERVASGCRLILWGLFKKMVIADRMAQLVSGVYNSPTQCNGFELTMGTYAFAIQIYCDFSGYTDVARGSAQALGIELMKNFDRPYFAASLTDFWRRWHISLSSWFRDYVYIPLGGNRTGKARWMFNIFITFVISGLWHGASRTFVIWGALHGGYLVLETLTGSTRQKLVQALGLEHWPNMLHAWRVLLTFHVVCLGWIYFRAEKTKDATYIVQHLWFNWTPSWSVAGSTKAEGVIALTLAIFLLSVEASQSRGALEPRIAKLPQPLRWAGYVTLILLIINLGVVETVPFIYFQF